MLRYRSFRNTDPPAITAIWRSRAGQPGLLQPVSVDLFEQFVFGKLYFDYAGMILAYDGDQPAGFAHASFGPNEQRTGVATETGVISMLLVRPEYEQSAAPRELLRRCEEYLVQRGAKVILAGATCPCAPFYVGLYGGAGYPGVLDSDAVARSLYPASGYEEVEHSAIYRCDLAAFHPPMNRQQMQYRRQTAVETRVDPPTCDWWEASTIGDLDLTQFAVVPRGNAEPLALATVRMLSGADGYVSGPAAGLLDAAVLPSQRQQGLGTFLLCESIRTLASQGIATLECQASRSNAAAIKLFEKLGFQQVAQGMTFRKELG